RHLRVPGLRFGLAHRGRTRGGAVEARRVERVGLVALQDERLRGELRRYGGPVALLAAATLVVVVVRAATHGSHPAFVPRAAPRPAVRAHPRPAPAPTHRVAIVSSGDTLGSIAAQAHTSVARLLALNPGVQPTALHVGQRLRIS